MTVDQNISSRIDLMRILLISGIVFVHVPYDPVTSPFNGTHGVFDWLRVFLGDSLFRIGVPCLSAISGYLLFRRGRAAFDYGRTLRSKVRTVLAPFLVWNLGLLLVVLLIQRYDTGIGYFPDLWNASFRDLLSHGLALEAFPVNLPLYFLRDLIVCILVSPLLAFLVGRAPLTTCGLLFALAVLPEITIGLVLKKSILFSFTFGIFLALHKVDAKALDRHAVAGIAATLTAAVVLATGLYWSGPDFPFVLELARNCLAILGAVGFWLFSAVLIDTRAGRAIAGTGSLSFWIFCAHYPLLVAMWMVWNRLSDGSGYAYFYVGAVISVFVILIVSNGFVSRYAPALYRVLTGSRGRSGRTLPEPPHGAAAPAGAPASQSQR